MALSTSSSVDISNKNIEIIVNKVMPVMSIGSLSQKSSHVLKMDVEASRRSLLASSVNNMTIMMSVTRASLYSNSSKSPAFNNRTESQINVNPMRLQLNCSQCENINIQICLVNYKARDYNPIDPLMSFETKCYNRNQTFTYTCVYPDNSRYKVSFMCNEKMNQTFITTCPLRRSTPSCELGGSFGVCYMSEYKSDYTICSCTICGTNGTINHRLLNNAKTSVGIVSYQFVSMTTFFYEDFASKMAAVEISAATLKQTLIVYISYASVWIFVTFFFLCKRWLSAASISTKRKKGRSATVISLVPAATQTFVSREKKEAILRDYLFSYLPPIFRHNTSVSLGKCLRSHHLHLSLLMNTNRNTINEVNCHYIILS